MAGKRPLPGGSNAHAMPEASRERSNRQGESRSLPQAEFLLRKASTDGHLFATRVLRPLVRQQGLPGAERRRPRGRRSWRRDVAKKLDLHGLRQALSIGRLLWEREAEFEDSPDLRSGQVRYGFGTLDARRFGRALNAAADKEPGSSRQAQQLAAAR